MGRVIYVGNLSSVVGDPQLQSLFTPFGSVQRVQVKMDPKTGRSRGFGYVQMSTPAEAEAAVVALMGTEYHGRALVVNDARAQLKQDEPGAGPALAS